MKKMMNIVLGTVIAAITIINNSVAAPEAPVLGQQVIRELGANVETANIVFKASVGDAEKQISLKNAREAAQTLLDNLNDLKTFGTNIIKGYNPAQRRQAALTLADLLMRENSLKIELESNRLKIRDMTDVGFIIDTAKPGKADVRSQAEKKQRRLHAELKDIRAAMNDQEMILGQPWSNTIKLAIHNLIVGNSYGIAYDIDWHAGTHGAKLTQESGTAKKHHASKQHMRGSAETKKQHAAIKSWHNLRKSEILSKEISTAYQLTQAKDLLTKLNNIKEDLKDVPARHQHVLDRVSESIDSLSRKIDRAKGLWLKVV